MRRPNAVVHDGTPETVEEDLAVMPRRVSRSLLRQLAEGERIVIRGKQHPIVLVRYLLWPAVALWFVWFLGVRVHSTTRLPDVATWFFLIGMLRFGWMWWEHRHAWFVATNKRILKHEGYLTRSLPMMRLTKITDMTYRRSLLGEVFGYGTIVIESAGQEQAIRDLAYVPDPDEVSAALNSEIFGERPRTKSKRDKRSWPRMTPPRPRRRRRRGDDGGDDDGSGGGPPRGRGPGPRDNDPKGVGGVDVSTWGHPTPPRTEPETWYRSSNLAAPRRLGDTGEIPAVHADDVAQWQAAGRPGRPAEPFDQDAALEVDPFTAWDGGSGADDADARGYAGADDGRDPDDGVREIPLYPPRDWVDRR